MRALVYHGPWQLSVEERPDPEPGPGRAVLRIHATGICGSDLHGFTGENGRRHPGQVMGHEAVGRVIDSGGRADLAPGMLATFNPVVGCGDCPSCRAGDQHHCPAKVVLGVHPEHSAGLAELISVPAGNVTPLPGTLDPDLGALIEPLAVGHHAVQRARPGPRHRVLVIGAGPIGQAVALAARRDGAEHVLVSEPAEPRRRLVGELGFAVADPGAAAFGEVVRDRLGGPADLVFDSVGSSTSVAAALTHSTPRARIVLVGMESPRLDLDAYKISTEERTVSGSFCYSPAEFDDTATWLAGEADGLARLIDHRVGLDDAPAAFAALARGTLRASKVLIYPQHADPEQER